MGKHSVSSRPLPLLPMQRNLSLPEVRLTPSVLSMVMVTTGLVHLISNLATTALLLKPMVGALQPAVLVLVLALSIPTHMAIPRRVVAILENVQATHQVHQHADLETGNGVMDNTFLALKT